MATLGGLQPVTFSGGVVEALWFTFRCNPPAGYCQMASLFYVSDMAVTTAAHLMHRYGVHCQPKRCAIVLEDLP